MSRTIILRIAGIGTDTDQAAFSSRPIAWATVNPVCIVSASDSFSSEITPFSSRGSSPSMSVSALYNAESGGLLLNRAFSTVADADSNPVTTTGYVPAARPATIGVTDSGGFTVGDVYSLGCEAVEVIAKAFGTLTIDTARGSAPVPHPYLSDGPAPGVTLYNRVPGIEGLRCVVSVCDDDATSEADEEVIFRGVVGSCDIDTSAGGELRIQITLASIIGAIDSSPWMPRQYAWVTGMLRSARGGQFDWCKLQGTVIVSAPVGYAGTASQTPVGFMYLIAGDSWMLYQVQEYSTGARTVRARMSMDGDNPPPLAFGHGRAFSGGPNRNFSDLPAADSAVGQDFASALSESSGYRSLVWQEVICAWTPLSLLTQVLTGFSPHFFGDESGWASAAWMDLYALDRSTFSRLADAIGSNAVTFTDAAGTTWFALPPRTGNSDKGLLAWLIETILEPACLALIVQDGVIRLVSWAAREAWPKLLTASNLAQPTARISFARNVVVQAVKVKALGVNSYADEISSPEVVYANRAAATEGGGQTISLTTANATVMVFGEGDLSGAAFVPGDSTVALAELLVSRYSRACPVAVVTVRDSSVRYVVGDQVIVTLATLPAADGMMGLTGCRGVVTRAQRKWQSGVTEYAVTLVGYSDAITRPPMWASTGTIVNDSGSALRIASNDYTRAPEGVGVTPWPQSDAEAWSQTLAWLGSGVRLGLLDKYGTPKAVTTAPFLDSVDVTNDELYYTGSWAPSTASADDVVVLATAPEQATPEAALDAFLADTGGAVAGPVGDFTGWRWLP